MAATVIQFHLVQSVEILNLPEQEEKYRRLIVFTDAICLVTYQQCN